MHNPFSALYRESGFYDFQINYVCSTLNKLKQQFVDTVGLSIFHIVHPWVTAGSVIISSLSNVRGTLLFKFSHIFDYIYTKNFIPDYNEIIPFVCKKYGLKKFLFISK